MSYPILIRWLVCNSNKYTFEELETKEYVTLTPPEVRSAASYICNDKWRHLDGPEKSEKYKETLDEIKALGYNRENDLYLKVCHRTVEENKPKKKFSLNKDLVHTTFLESLAQYEVYKDSYFICRTTVVIPESDFQEILKQYKSYLDKELNFHKKQVRKISKKLERLFDADSKIFVGENIRKKVRIMRMRGYHDLHDQLPKKEGKFLPVTAPSLWEDNSFKGIKHFSARKNSAFIELENNLEIVISEHAFQQWRDRGASHFKEGWKGTKSHAMRHLIALLKTSSVVRRSNRVTQFFKHGKEAVYRTSQGWIFVIEKPNTLKTCYFKGNIKSHGYEFVEGSDSVFNL